MLTAVRGYQLAGGEGLNNKLGSNKVREENNYRWRGAAAEGMKLKGSGEDRLESEKNDSDRRSAERHRTQDTTHKTPDVGCHLVLVPESAAQGS